MILILSSLPKTAEGCLSTQLVMVSAAIQRSHSPEPLRRLSKATSEIEATPPCLALTAVSLSEQPSARWISKVLSKDPAPLNPRHRTSAPSSLAFSSQPLGKKVNKVSQSCSPCLKDIAPSIVTSFGDDYTLGSDYIQYLKLALMGPGGEVKITSISEENTYGDQDLRRHSGGSWWRWGNRRRQR